jgi:class 3 adenylate cyclase/alpha-beta hydrolase superfamily lysophospholipase
LGGGHAGAWETYRAVKAPDVRYARSGNIHVAYQVFGEGEFDLVVVPGALSNIEYGWEFASWQNYYGALASFARVLLFDKRGTGISDPVPSAPSVEERMDDVRAVMDAAGSERAALIGSLDGGAMAALFAATYPERVAALILNTPVVRGRWASDYPWGSRHEADTAASIASWWGTRQAVEEYIAETLPGRVGDDEFARQLTSYMRLSASPTTFAKMLDLNLALDVRAALSTIRAPTLVIHHEPPRDQRDDPAYDEAYLERPVEASRYVAERIPGARFVEWAPGDATVWSIDQGAALALVEEFLTGAWNAGAWEPSEPDRVLATLLFTDIVGSTERAAELGDAGWRDLVQRHHAVVRQQLLRFRGQEIDTAGDGFFASFDGPARAVRCASAIVAGVPALGLDVRAGLHTGECELIDGKPGGMAVVVGARIASIAPSGAVLASSTVKDLVVGSGIAFEDVGEHELKGVPGAWKLHAVVSAEARG